MGQSSVEAAGGGIYDLHACLLKERHGSAKLNQTDQAEMRWMTGGCPHLHQIDRIHHRVFLGGENVNGSVFCKDC